MPSVLDIALGELVGGRAEQMLAGEAGPGHGEGHAVLGTSDASWTHATALDFAPSRMSTSSGAKPRHDPRPGPGCGDHAGSVRGPLSDWTFAPETIPFDARHQFEFLPGGLLLFDTGAIDAADSRIVEYAMDRSTCTFTQRWERRDDPPTYEWALGDVARDAEGGTRATWTTAGRIDWIRAAGDRYASLSMPAE